MATAKSELKQKPKNGHVDVKSPWRTSFIMEDVLMLKVEETV